MKQSHRWGKTRQDFVALVGYAILLDELCLLYPSPLVLLVGLGADLLQKCKLVFVKALVDAIFCEVYKKEKVEGM
jgi:hypothetical protein